MSQNQDTLDLSTGDQPQHKVTAKILAIALSAKLVLVKLQNFLETIFARILFGFYPKGCIFLSVPCQKLLQLAVHKSFSVDQIRHCAEVLFGQCIFGRATRNRSLEYFREMEVTDAANDFGSAYSSLSYLNRSRSIFIWQIAPSLKTSSLTLAMPASSNQSSPWLGS
jgi:hypothetical protein